MFTTCEQASRGLGGGAFSGRSWGIPLSSRSEHPVREPTSRIRTNDAWTGLDPLEPRVLLSHDPGFVPGTDPLLDDQAPALEVLHDISDAVGTTQSSGKVADDQPAAGTSIDIAMPATTKAGPSASSPLPSVAFPAGYRTVAQLYGDLDKVHSEHPDITKIVPYGDSFCMTIGGCSFMTPQGTTVQVPAHELKAIKITNDAIPGPKPVFVIMAGIHAREIAVPEVAMRFVDFLTDGYGQDSDATWIVDWQETWVIPTANPDGHVVAEMDVLQRKNLNFAGTEGLACDP